MFILLRALEMEAGQGTGMGEDGVLLRDEGNINSHK